MQRVNEELLKLIILEIKNNNKITEKELANKYYYSERTIRRYFKILKDSDQLKLINTGKNRCWKLLC